MVPQPKKTEKQDAELATELAKKIVTSEQLRTTSTLEDVTIVIAKFIEKQYPEFRIDYLAPEMGVEGLSARKKKAKKDDPDDLSDIFDTFTDEPLTDEEQTITDLTGSVYSLVLKKYGIIKQADYKSIIEKMGLEQFKTVPNYSEVEYDEWASKIIEQFIITNDATVEKITNSVIQFFQMLIPDYLFKYYLWKDKKKYPLRIDKKGDDSLFYVFEINQIRGILFNIHYILLTKLQRQKDYPKDPDFWFDLVVLYEELGQKEKGYELGSHGLKLNPKEIGALSNLISYYLEKRQVKDSLRFYKHTAHIYKAKNILTVAEKSWKQIISVEPNSKENWQNLAEILTELGNEEEAQKCLERIKHLSRTSQLP